MTAEQILCVDDDENFLAALQRNLRKQFSIEVAIGGPRGLELLARQGVHYAVVVADMQMPSMSGIQFLKKVESRWPEAVRVMLTGNADQKTAMDAVNEGHVFRFLTKPCSMEAFGAILQAAIAQHRLIVAERELLQNTLNGSVKILTEILSTMDPQSFGKAQQLKEAMQTFLQHFQVGHHWELELAALLCPIGRVTIPATVLLKSCAGLTLNCSESEMLQRVPEIGAGLLAKIPRLENVAAIVRYQAKNYDGSGCPADSRQGERIPMGARIIKVLNDLLELEREQHSRASALGQMQLRSGTYDPNVLAAASKAFDVYLDPSETERLKTASLSICELMVGMILAMDLKTADGQTLVASGNRITPMLLERLRNYHALGTIPDSIDVFV